MPLPRAGILANIPNAEIYYPYMLHCKNMSGFREIGIKP